jgi:hypothetical protein
MYTGRLAKALSSDDFNMKEQYFTATGINMPQLLMSQVPDPSLDCLPPLVSSSATYSNQRIIQDLVTTILLSTTSKLPPSSAALSGMSNAQQIDFSEWKLSATSAGLTELWSNSLITTECSKSLERSISFQKLLQNQ